jgi:hypothetical protein
MGRAVGAFDIVLYDLPFCASENKQQKIQGSFDSGAHDKAVSASAQDDGENKRPQVLRLGATRLAQDDKLY